MAAISESRSNTATAGATRWYAATCSGLAVCRNVAGSADRSTMVSASRSVHDASSKAQDA